VIYRPLEIRNPEERLLSKITGTENLGKRTGKGDDEKKKKIVIVDCLEEQENVTVRLVDPPTAAELEGVDGTQRPPRAVAATSPRPRKPTPIAHPKLLPTTTQPVHTCTHHTSSDVNTSPSTQPPPAAARRRDFVFPSAIAVKRSAWRYSAAALEDCDRERVKNGTCLLGSEFRNMRPPIAITDPDILDKMQEIRRRGAQADEAVERRKEMLRWRGVEALGEGVRRRFEEVRRESRHLVLEGAAEEGDDYDDKESNDNIRRDMHGRPSSWAPSAEMRNEWDDILKQNETLLRSDGLVQPRQGLRSPTRRPKVTTNSPSPPLPLRPTKKRSLILDGEPHWSPPPHFPSPTELSPPLPPQHTSPMRNTSPGPIWYPPTPAPSATLTSNLPEQMVDSSPRPPVLQTSPPHKVDLLTISAPYGSSSNANPPAQSAKISPSRRPVPPPHSPQPHSPPSQLPRHLTPISPPQSYPRNTTPLSPKIPPSLSSNIRTPPHLYPPNQAPNPCPRPTIRIVPKETKSTIGRRGRNAIMSRWTESLLRQKREFSRGVEIVTEQGDVWRCADAVLGNEVAKGGKRFVKRVRDRRGDGLCGEGRGEEPVLVMPPPPPPPLPVGSSRPDTLPQGYSLNNRSDASTGAPHTTLSPSAAPRLSFQSPFTVALPPTTKPQPHLPGPFAEPSAPNSRTATPNRPASTAFTDDSVVSNFSDLMRPGGYIMRSPAERGGLAPPYARAQAMGVPTRREVVGYVPQGGGLFSAYQI